MSRLQIKAKPYVSKLAIGEWPELDKTSADIISAWAVMFTMVHEYTHPEKADAVPQHHRNFLRSQGIVPKDWFVWLGRADFGFKHPGTANQHYVKMLRINEDGLAFQHSFQSIAFTVGKAIFSTLMLTPPNPLFPVAAEQFALGYSLRQLHPQPRNLSDPVVVHDWSGFVAISNDAVTGIGRKPFVIAGERK